MARWSPAADHPRGGLPWRGALLEQLRKDYQGPTFVIDGGDLAFGPRHDLGSRQWRAPLADALARGAHFLRYDAVAAGEQDLLPDPSAWGGAALPWVSSDLVDAAGRFLYAPFRVVAHDGVRLGVIALSGGAGGHRGWHALPPREALRRTVGAARERSDLVVLLSHLPASHLPRAAFAGVDVVVDVHDASSNFVARPGDPLVVSPMDLGRYVGVIWVTRAAVAGGRPRVDRSLRSPMTWERIPVDPVKRVDPTLAGWVEEALRKANRSAGRVAFPPTSLASVPAGFAGAQACRTCHAAQYGQWESTAHHRALQTLEIRNQDHFPACVQCHVTGLRPDPPDSSPDAFAWLPDVQCEACHGPGLAHVQDPTRVLPPATVSIHTCTACHDRSVDQGRFNARTYFPRVRH